MLVPLLLAAPLAAQQAYLVDSDRDTLYSVDLNTGAATTIASTLNNNLGTPADLVWRNDTQELWTIDLSGGEVGTIHVTTGQFTPLFQTNLSGWQGMAFVPATGNFILANQNGTNYVLDPRTGMTTPLGSAGSGFGLITALDVDPAGVVWGVDFSSGYLATIDTMTGAATHVATTLTGLQGLAITSAGVFYATSTNTDSLYTIDPRNGNATLVGAHGANVQFAKGFDTIEGGCFIAKTGTGCKDASNTTLAMRWVNRPCIDSTDFQIGTRTGTTFPVYFLALGTSNKTWGPLRLPFDLSSLGAPGCHVYSSQVTTFGLPQGQNLTLPIPNDPTLDGLHLYFQGFVLDPRVNALGIATSDLAIAGIGK